MKQIKVKTDPKTKDAYLDITDFEDLFDISQVKKYTIDEEKGSLILKFFDDKDQPVTAGPKFLNLQEASKELALNENEVLGLISKNKLKLVPVGGSSCLIKTDVERYKNKKG